MINSLITRKFVPLRCHHFIAIFGIYSQSNGILWKKCATQPPGIYIVNQGRRSTGPTHPLSGLWSLIIIILFGIADLTGIARFIFPIHCHTFWHR